MEHMRRIAFETILRACGFGSLAIFCVMIGLSFQLRAAFQAGGFLTMLMAAILMHKAYEPPHTLCLLRARRERPDRRSAEKGDELAPPHSRTSLARATNASGKETPSDAAVFRLTAM